MKDIEEELKPIEEIKKMEEQMQAKLKAAQDKLLSKSSDISDNNIDEINAISSTEVNNHD